MKNERRLKIYYNRNNMPMMILQGRWLKLLGYEIGDKIRVDIKKDKIIIHKI